MNDLFAAAWCAPLRWGGLPSDVHALLVLPAVHALNAACQTRGVDPSPALLWAIGNASQWCTSEKKAAPHAVEHADLEWLTHAIDNEDATLAARLAFSICMRDGLDSMTTWLTKEALRPREDVHGAIYAAQFLRMSPHLRAEDRAWSIAHVAQYLARNPRIELAQPLELPSWDALALQAANTRAQDASLSGWGVHKTTLLDALAYLHARLAPSDANAMYPLIVSAVSRERPASVGPPEQTAPSPSITESEVFRRIVSKGADEHTFKYWAAVEALSSKLNTENARSLRDGFSSLSAVHQP